MLVLHLCILQPTTATTLQGPQTGKSRHWARPLTCGSVGWYPLVNIQKAIEHGHRNSGFTA